MLELLIVIVMIGVLLGVGIPVFVNYLNSGSDTTAQSSLASALQAADTYFASNQSSYAGICPTISCGSGPNPVGFAAQGSGLTPVAGTVSSRNPQTVSIWNSPDGLEVVITALSNDTHACWAVIEDRQPGRVDLGYPARFSHLYIRERAPSTGKPICNAGSMMFRSHTPDVTATSLTAWPPAN